MKTILKIFLTLTALITISCDNMYNDIAYEIGAEYNYYLASTDPLVAGNIRTYPLSYDGLPNFSNVKISSTVNQPFFPAVHPTGKFLYAPSIGSNLLHMFKVNDDGSLNSLGSFTPSSINRSYAVKVHPTGKYVYLIDNDNSATALSMYIVKSDGTLMDNGTVSSGVKQDRLAINPAGTCLYVLSNNLPTDYYISAYKIENNGKLTLINSFNPVPYNQYITDINIHPNGKYIYIARLNGFDKYNFKSNGDIDYLSRSSTSTSAGVGYIATHPSGNFLYYIGDDGNMRSYIINSAGVVSPNNQISFSSTICDLIIHPQGKYLYAASNSDNQLFYITINNDGKVNSSSFENVKSRGLALIRKRKE